MIVRLIAPVAIAVLCGATLLQIISPSTPRIIYNPSPSAPVGWYRLNIDAVPETGDLVAAFAPISAADLAVERHYLPPDIPIIKTVWATAGDEICHLEGQVFTSNRPPLSVLSHDSFGREMPSLSGCYVIPENEVFLVSTDVQTSFDSRYFGPVPVSNILGQVRYLGKFQWGGQRRKAGRG